jgi:hypothetical protein
MDEKAQKDPKTSRNSSKRRPEAQNHAKPQPSEVQLTDV